MTSPILVKSNLYKEFTLETDASQHQLAAVLLQYDDDDLPRAVGYFSKKLKRPEVRYSATDREVLAIVQACRQFHHYLWGTKFVIRTDHQPIITVLRQRTKSPRMNRWMLEMRDYRFRVEYKRGKNNVVADQLSRPVRVIHGSEDGTWLGKSREEIQALQRKEPRWREMVEFLEGGRVPRSKYPRATLDQFVLEDGILYLCKQKLNGKILYLLIVLNELRKDALRLMHEKESGHLGQHKSILKTEEYFYWPNLRKDMKAYFHEITGTITPSFNWTKAPSLCAAKQPIELPCIEPLELCAQPLSG